MDTFLVRNEHHARAVLEMLDSITASLAQVSDRTADDFRILRQALTYGWSVAIVGCPALGKPLLEKWLQSSDRDIAWLAHENLKKDRLKRLDPGWVAERLSR